MPNSECETKGHGTPTLAGACPRCGEKLTQEADPPPPPPRPQRKLWPAEPSD